MNRGKGEWTDAVRRTLNQAKEPLPEGGWRRLEHELGAPAPRMPRMVSREIWMKFAAAVAVVLVCVSVGFRVIRSDRDVLDRVVVVQGATVSEQNTDAEELTSSAPVDIAASPEEISSAVRSVVVSHGEQVDAIAALTPEVQNAREMGVVTGAEAFAVEDRASQKTTPSVPQGRGDISDSREVGVGDRSEVGVVALELEDKAIALLAETSTDVQVEDALYAAGDGASSVTIYDTADYDGLFAHAEPRRRALGGSFGVAAGGVVTSADGGTLGLSPSLLLLDNDGVASLWHAYSEYTYKHRQPLGLGLTFSKRLGYGLSLESGLVYTLLRSDVTVPGALHDIHQRLHLLGIPLRLNWEFLRVGGFSLYAGVGGRAEMCVSARFGDENISERQVQWSVFGAVGAQYMFGKRVGLYFEPEVSHYFTQTSLRTPYTDSPISLNLQLGLRFNY